jgi:4-hydroxy-tetrahydrodipicolinate reductase
VTISTVVCGRDGRMANLIADAVERAPGVRLTARYTARCSDPYTARVAATAGPVPVVTDLAEVPGTPPVVVDFTAPEATAALLRQASVTPCPLVIGTSGLGEGEHALAAAAGLGRAVVVAANFSLALLAVARFVRDLSDQVDESWDAGIVDVHFAGKRDRPSNTARFLAGQWRPDRPGRREPEVGAFRMGDAVSEHRMLAAGAGEHVEVLHRVADRAAFLPGILRAVRFAAGAPPGVYSLEDVACAAVPR